MAKVILFDIDQTLLYTGGAGTKAMDLAFREVFGIADGFAGVEFSGRTDVAILRDALGVHSIQGDFSTWLERFKESYFRYLERALPETTGSLLPGVGRLLEELGRRQEALVGLATGNFQVSAELKLRHYGIWHHFRGGAFADDAEERAEIVRLAVLRLAGEAADAHQALVVGDTPHDIASAKAVGALAVGVATGSYSLEELRRSGADIALQDLSDWRTTIASFLAPAR